jgi:hypothetical protein
LFVRQDVNNTLLSSSFSTVEKKEGKFPFYTNSSEIYIVQRMYKGSEGVMGTRLLMSRCRTIARVFQVEESMCAKVEKWAEPDAPVVWGDGCVVGRISGLSAGEGREMRNGLIWGFKIEQKVIS